MDEAHHLIGTLPYPKTVWLIVASHAPTSGACAAIADKYGFHCQMWSDMPFKLMSADGQYDQRWKFQKKLVFTWTCLQHRDSVYWIITKIARKIQSNLIITTRLARLVAFAGAWKWTAHTNISVV